MERETVKIAWGERDALRSRAVGTGFQYKFHQCDCPEKLCAQDFSSDLQTLGDGTYSLVGRERR